MLFKLDENLRSDVGDPLLELGHDVSTVYDQGLRGKEDHEIAETCRVEGRILISMDLDFSNIQMFPPANYSGLIVLRLRAAVRTVFQRVLSRMDREPIVG